MMTNRRTIFPAILTAATFLSMAALFNGTAIAQAPTPTKGTTVITATSANVSGAGEKVEFYVNKWSTDDERDKLAAAWKVTPPPAASGGARGGDDAAAAGRGGRAGGRGGGNTAPAAPRTPEAALTAALKELPAAGFFWTSEVGGYVIRYATRVTEPAGGTRIILLTDKRLGTAKDNWRPAPAAGTPNTYEFSLIELRLPAKGDGEGKASLTGTIAIDPVIKAPALEGYDALPVTLRAVKARNES
jgi:hypothetical protein